MKHINIFLVTITLLLLLSSCMPEKQMIKTSIRTTPLYPINPMSDHFLLLSGYDITTQKYSQNKEEMFINLIDTALLELSNEFSAAGTESKVLRGFTSVGKTGPTRDSIILAWQKRYNSTHAIAITYFNVSIDQTDVQVTIDENGKTREAFYDIVSNIKYILYDQKGAVKEINTEQRQFHSSRLVLSGLLASGPNIVNNESDAVAVVAANVREFLKNIFPAWEERNRFFIIDKKLATPRLQSALFKGDYEAALKESLLYVNNPDLKLAAIANYNCAVLFERMKKPANVKFYLEQALIKYNLPDAIFMMKDYEN